MLKPKSKGSGIMVSDFVDEHNGFLALSDEEYDAAKMKHPNIRKYGCEFLEYGENREGYWTRDSSRRWNVQLSSLRSNTQRRKVGGMCGYLITAAAMQQWQTMPSMLTR